jgi:hypothetical protein
MSEQISRRANNVTASAFDAPFETPVIRCGVGSLNLKDSLDAMEGWSRMTNIWHEHEGEATGRPGQTSLATFPAGQACHSIRAMRDPSDNTQTRLWGVGTELRRGNTGATASAATGFSGHPLTLLPHRPPLSGVPWMFIADDNKMVKVRADGLVLPIGLPEPDDPPGLSLGDEERTDICDFSDAGIFTAIGGKDQEGNDIDPPDVIDDHSLPEGAPLSNIYFTTNGGTAETDYDCWIGTALDLNLSMVGGEPASDDDIIHVWLKTSHPQLVGEVRIYLNCGDDFDPTAVPGVPDSETGEVINQDAYVKSFRQHDFVQFIQLNQTQIEAAETARVYALRDTDLKDRAYKDRRPSWEENRARQDSIRSKSLQFGAGSHQWFELGVTGVPLRRGDFQRIGGTFGRDWGTITGLLIYVKLDVDETSGNNAGFGIGDLYLTGGRGPDTSEPGLQPYDYRYTHYDPRTGAEGNPSPEQDLGSRIDPVRRAVVVSPAAYGDGAVRQRFYRRGASLIDDWYYCGENDSDGGDFVDELTDSEIVAAGTVATDHFEPIPTVAENGDTVFAQPLPALWGPLEGMLFGCGDPYRPGHVYYSLPDAPDHWSASGNTEVCPPSEELMHGGMIGHQGFVFSRARLHFLYPNLSGPGGGVTATPSLCTRGLQGRWAFCIGPGGIIYFVAEDGVYATSGGPEDWLSEAINPLFYGTAVNGYLPIDKTQEHMLRLTVWENCLYFLYQDTSGARQVMVYSILQKFWRHYHFGQLIATVQGEDEPVLLLGGDGTGAAYSHSGTSDGGSAIGCVLRTGSANGGRREEKLFGDLFLDADVGGTDLALQIFLNEETHQNPTESIISGVAGVGRQRYLVHAFGINPQKAHSIACELRWATSGAPPTLYQLGYAITMQPDLTNARVTNWDDLNSPDEVWLTGITLDCDTGGLPKELFIERDFGGQRTVAAAITVPGVPNRHKHKFSWPAVPANLVRIRPDPADCVPWLLYRADWIYVQEPPRISQWDIHFENSWDQYYTGLDLYCDTVGQEKRIEVWVDNVRLVNTLGGNLPYWPITTNGRQVVHLTLPWGRGHVFRFVAIDANPGLLYTHRWHLQEEPSEQANWNQNFSILGTRADKWLKAIVFECDTFGQPKAVQIEVDGAVVETLTVTTSGRKVVQLALPAQHLGRVWRMFPVDSHPGRLYSAEPIFDEEPFQLDRWETQETNHGLPGWFYPLFAHVTLKSTADVVLTTTIQHNQVGGTTVDSYTIPATSGQKQRRFLAGFKATKGVLIKYVLTSAAPFWLYRDETVLTIQPWGAQRSITVQPFGNDDLDPSRPMTHAVLAAQASGGAPIGPAGGA